MLRKTNLSNLLERLMVTIVITAIFLCFGLSVSAQATGDVGGGVGDRVLVDESNNGHEPSTSSDSYAEVNSQEQPSLTENQREEGLTSVKTSPSSHSTTQHESDSHLQTTQGISSTSKQSNPNRVHLVNWDRVHQLKAEDYVLALPGQEVAWKTQPRFTGQKDMALTAVIYDEAGAVVKEETVNVHVSTAQTRRHENQSGRSGTNLRQAGTVRDGVIDLNNYISQPGLKVLVNGLRLSNGGVINEGDEVSVELSFQIDRKDLSLNNANVLTYSTNIPLVEATPAKPFIVNQKRVGSYSVSKTGTITINISDEEFDNLDNINWGSVLEYKGVATVISDTSKTVNLGSTDNKVTLQPKIHIPEYGVDISKGHSYEESSGLTSYTLRVSAINDGSPDDIIITDTLTYTKIDSGFSASYVKDSFQVVKNPDNTPVNVSPIFNGDSFTLNLGKLGKGESYTITYNVQSSVNLNGEINNTATVKSGDTTKTVSSANAIKFVAFNINDYQKPKNVSRISKGYIVNSQRISNQGSINRD